MVRAVQGFGDEFYNVNHEVDSQSPIPVFLFDDTRCVIQSINSTRGLASSFIRAAAHIVGRRQEARRPWAAMGRTTTMVVKAGRRTPRTRTTSLTVC